MVSSDKHDPRCRVAQTQALLYVQDDPFDGGCGGDSCVFPRIFVRTQGARSHHSRRGKRRGGVADQVATALPAWEGFTQYSERPRIVVLPTQNHTKFDVDTVLATTKLVNGLIRVSGETFDVIDPQTWAQRTEEGADTQGLLLLQSDLRATPTDDGSGGAAVQVLVTYRLVEADSARAVWASDFEWTKVKGPDGYEAVAEAPDP